MRGGFESAVRQRLGADMQQNIAPLMRGSAPVAAVVPVCTLDAPSPVRPLLGELGAIVQAAVNKYDPGAKMLDEAVTDYKEWLERR